MNNLIQNIKGEKIIWLIILLLSLFSILAVYSSTTTLAYKFKGGDTEFYLFRHAVLIMTGLLIMYLVHRLDYRVFSKLAIFGLALTVPLLLLPWFWEKIRMMHQDGLEFLDSLFNHQI